MNKNEESYLIDLPIIGGLSSSPHRDWSHGLLHPGIWGLVCKSNPQPSRASPATGATKCKKKFIKMLSKNHI